MNSSIELDPFWELVPLEIHKWTKFYKMNEEVDKPSNEIMEKLLGDTIILRRVDTKYKICAEEACTDAWIDGTYGTFMEPMMCDYTDAQKISFIPVFSVAFWEN